MTYYENKKWFTIGQSVRGASHVRLDMPNQDNIQLLPIDGSAEALVMAVADGHGSASHFRSQEGSRFAVQAATQTITAFFKGDYLQANLGTIRQEVEDKLLRMIVNDWQDRIECNLQLFPITESEWETLRLKTDEQTVAKVKATSLIAFGATLLAVLLTERFILFLQLGDGDIITVSGEGQVSRPLQADERLLGNATTSLCQTEAWKEFRLRLYPLEAGCPALIMVSTDGYSNSFVSEAAFHKVGSDLLELARQNHPQYIDEHLEEWLQSTTANGSGDDITVGIIGNLDLCRQSVTADLVSENAGPFPGEEEETQVTNVSENDLAQRGDEQDEPL